MSDIQLPDYPWEHPHESDYEEARAMSDWRKRQTPELGNLKRRIAELEAERDKLTIENVDLAISTGKRRAELEAELSAQQQTAANLAAYTTRIAELEAEVKRLTDTLAEAVVDAAYWKRRATRNAP